MTIILASEARNLLQQLKHEYGYNLDGMKIAAITTAMSGEVDNAPWYAHEIYTWHKENIYYDEIDIAGYDQEQLFAALNGYDVIYVVGGHTQYLLYQFKHCNFESWLEQFLQKGGIYIGTCAGAMIMGPSIDHINLMPCKYGFDIQDVTGFNYFNKRLVCHVNWENEHISLIKKYRQLYGRWEKSDFDITALNDYQGILIENNEIHFIG